MPGSSEWTTAAVQDPVIADPKHYSVLIDNEQVRVLRINYGAKEKSPMHSHPDAIAVFQGDQRARFTLPDGQSLVRDMEAGQVAWMPAEIHAPENLGDKPLRLILVELKGDSRAAKAAPPASQDPVSLDPQHNQVLIDNERVRVFLTSYGAHEKTEMHGHPDYVAVFLTDARVRFANLHGKSETIETKAGQVIWQSAHVHSSENEGNQPCKVVLIELKPKPGPRLVR